MFTNLVAGVCGLVVMVSVMFYLAVMTLGFGVYFLQQVGIL